MIAPSLLSTGLLCLALAMLFTAERVLPGSGASEALRWACGVSVAAGILLRILRLSRSPVHSRGAECALLFAQIGAVTGILLYALATAEGLQWAGVTSENPARMRGILAAMWPTVLSVSLGTLGFMELALRNMPVAEALEPRRLYAAGRNGASLSLALVFVFSVNFSASERDWRQDLSYFRTTEPSASTLNMVEALGEDLRVVLFYPEVNEVLEQIGPYFDAVGRASERIEVRRRDHALAAKLARDHRVRANGSVLLLRGEGEGARAESFEVGITLERARTRLRTLDGRFQKAFLKLTKPRLELHFTEGHDERRKSGVEGDPKGLQLQSLMKVLERSNVRAAKLGLTQGLANEVPDDTPAVAVVGPRRPFLAEESAALLRYVKRGGRLVLLLDPGADHGLTSMLEQLGLRLRKGTAASMDKHMRSTFSEADRGVVIADRFSAHPTVTIASRSSGRAAVVMYMAAALAEIDRSSRPDGLEVSFPIRSDTRFWRDTNANWTRDPDTEREESLNLMAAVTVGNEAGKEGRVVLIGDGDFLSDAVFRLPGNQVVFADVMRWMLGEEQIVAGTSSEEDVRIEHSRDEDKVWFYLTSFGLPLPLLGVGLWIAMRRRERSETHLSSMGTDVVGTDAISGNGVGEKPGESADARKRESETDHEPPGWRGSERDGT